MKCFHMSELRVKRECRWFPVNLVILNMLCIIFELLKFTINIIDLLTSKKFEITYINEMLSPSLFMKFLQVIHENSIAKICPLYIFLKFINSIKYDAIFIIDCV